jgi:peptidoglycan/LPS O-acetylase OafA/YrhL
MRDRIAVLDGLRALAIIAVLARHSVEPFWRNTTLPFARLGNFEVGNLFLNGWMGVDLFFVLSGFLIGQQLLQNGDALAFYKRRFFRIAPAYYLVLTLVSLGLFPGLPHAKTATFLSGSYFYHLFFLQDVWPANICVVFWSLAIEMQYYLLAPVLIYAMMKLPNVSARIFAIAALILVEILLRYVAVAYWLPPSNSYLQLFQDIKDKFEFGLDGVLVGTLYGLEKPVIEWAKRPLENRL